MVQGNDASPYVTANRPWLELYNTRVPRPRLKRKSLETPHQGKCEGAEDPEQHSVEEEPPELAPIQKLLDDEMLANVLQFLPTYGVAHAACVCTAWRRAAENARLWESACDKAFCDSPAEENRQQLREHYGGSWKRMFLGRPHVRFDGLYISRNTYLRVGEGSFRVKKNVHIVLYFRYLRFLPGGELVYRTCPHFPKDAAPTMANYERHVDRPANQREGVNIMKGRYRLDPNGRLCTAVFYPGSKSTEVRSLLLLRSLAQGANNRIDVKEIVTYDRELGRALPQPADLGEDDEEDEQIPGRKRANRGLNTYVFVPWEWIANSVLNLPIEEMDYYVTG